MATMCRTLQCLPRSGGLYEQDWFDALRLVWVTAYQSQKEHKDIEAQKKKRK